MSAAQREVEMRFHEVQRNLDFAYFEAERPDTMPDSERPDGYYFPKRDWVEMDMPEVITVTVGQRTEFHNDMTIQRVHDVLRSSSQLPPENVTEIIGQLQNAGILFRERA